MNPTSRRVPALDGLRGLAVVAVVVYHAWPEVLPGGWIGVSLFFTLSGYLITDILVRNHELTGSSLVSFWRRRARRLLPAALLTIAATTLAVAVSDRDAVAETSDAAIAAVLYVHNWWAAATGDGYWDIFETSPSPLAHMWSLAIEEQVYLFWPLLVLGLGLRRAVGLGIVLVVAGYALWWGSADAYYATPVRFAEVVAGAAVALAVQRRPAFRVPGAVAFVAGTVVLGLTATLAEDHAAVARGVLLLIAAASAALVGWVRSGGLADRLLGGSVLGWLGRRSYAIYLFHWPLLVLLEVPPVGAVGVTLVLAEVSHRLVEWPIRTEQRLRRPLLALGAASLTTLAAVSVVGAVVTPVSDEDVIAAVADALREAPPAPASTVSVEPAPVESAAPADSGSAASAVAVTTTMAPTTTTAPPVVHVPSDATVLLAGDSVAFAAVPAFIGWVEASGGVPRVKAAPICSPVFNDTEWTEWEHLVLDFSMPCRPNADDLDGVDLVVVMDFGAVLGEHRSTATGEVSVLTDPVLAAAVDRGNHDLIDLAGAVGAQVVFLTPPLPLEGVFVGPAEALVAAYDRLLESVADEPGVLVHDSGALVDADPDRYPRADGMHFDADTGAVNFFVDVVAPIVVFDG